MKANGQPPITRQELRNSTLLFSLLAAVLIIPLLRVAPADLLMQSGWLVIGSASLFWGCLSLLAFRYFWELYYRYIYPDWLRKFGATNFLLYGVIAWILCWLVPQDSRTPILLFLCLGGIEGLLEHVIGIYLLGVLEKVPWLQGLDQIPILLFSFVEYIVYWSVVLWLTMGLRALI